MHRESMVDIPHAQGARSLHNAREDASARGRPAHVHQARARATAAAAAAAAAVLGSAGRDLEEGRIVAKRAYIPPLDQPIGVLGVRGESRGLMGINTHTAHRLGVRIAGGDRRTVSAFSRAQVVQPDPSKAGAHEQARGRVARPRDRQRLL